MKKPTLLEIKEAFSENSNVIRGQIKLLRAEIGIEKANHRNILKRAAMSDLRGLFGLEYYDLFKIVLATCYTDYDRLRLLQNNELMVSKVKKLKSLDVEKARQTPIESIYTLEQAKFGPARIQCICPFHNDTKPSMVVYRRTNSFYCFVCNAGGDVINFYSRLTGVTFQEAVKQLGG